MCEHWCEFCEDCPASEVIVLVWDDTGQPVDDPALMRFVRRVAACFNCAQSYDGLHVADAEARTRKIRMKWEGRPD
jgi:hypothetical protein